MSAAQDIRVVIDTLALPIRGDGDAFAAAVVAELTRLLSESDSQSQLETSFEARRVHVDSANVSPQDVAAVVAGIVLGAAS